MRQMIANLRRIWSYSDSQPTEITLAIAIAILAPIAVSIEVNTSWFFNALLILAGLYQIRCIAKEEIGCRVKAAYFTTMMYMTCLLMYIVTIGLPTPSHWGWVLLTYSSFSTLSRLKTEQLRRNEY